jgi:hypothetical protein
LPTITLRDGDFGTSGDVRVGLSTLYLPDLARPGLTVPVAFTDIVDIESLADDRSGQVAEAVKLGLKGMAVAGPAGLLNSARALGRGKDVVFRVRLRDGRAFVATASARVLADFRSEVLHAQVPEDTGAADAIIARYMRGEATLDPPAAVSPEAPAAPDAAPSAGPSGVLSAAARPVFGRRQPS